MARNTFTTYLNTAADNAELAAFDKLGSKALSTYGAISRAAEQASASAAGLIGGRGSAGLGVNVTTALKSRATAIGEVGRASSSAAGGVDSLNRATLRNDVETKGATATQKAFASALRNTAIGINVVQGPLGPLAGRITAAATALETLTGIPLGLAGLGVVVTSVGRVASAYQDTASKLAPFFDSQRQANIALEDAGRIALVSRAALEPVVGLYSRLTLAGKAYGISIGESSRLTELAAKAARLSGGSKESQKAGLEQFAQAIGSNNFAGDELKSVKENTAQLAIAIAQGFRNVDGTIGTTVDNLRKLGSEGKLTSREVADALLRAGDDIEAKFARLPVTLSSGITSIGTSLSLVVGRFDTAVQFTNTLGNGLTLIADNLRVIAVLAAAATAAFVFRKGAGLASAVSDAVALKAATRAAAVEARDAATAAVTQATQRTAAIAAERKALGATVSTLRERVKVETELANKLTAQASTGAAGKRRLYEQPALVARQQLAITTDQLNKAETQATVVQQRYGAAVVAGVARTKELDVATANVTTKMGMLRGAGSSLVSFLGGPWGIAFTLAVTALSIFASRATDAETATKGLTVQQRLLAEAARESAQALDLSSEAAARASRQKAGDTLDAGGRDYLEKRRVFTARVQYAVNRAGVGGADGQALAALLRDARAGGDLDDVYKRFSQIRDRNPSLQRQANPNFIQSALGRSRTDIEDALGDVRGSATSLRFLRENVSKAGKAVDDFSSRINSPAAGKPPTKAELDRRASALANSSSGNPLLEARGRRDTALQSLEAQRATLGDDEYVKQRAAIVKSYNDEVAGIRASNAATRSANASARREASEARREAIQAAKDAAETKKTDSLTSLEEGRGGLSTQQYLDGRVRILATYDAEINAIEGIRSKSDDAGKERERQARAVGAAEQALTQEFERQNQINDLLLRGREAEAEALRRTLVIVDQVGERGRENYNRILAQVKAEQQVNDALNARQRVVQSITGVLDTARDGFTDLLVDLPERGLSAAGDYLGNVAKALRRSAAQQITETVFAGADAKVRDLISGTGGVERQASFVATQFESTGNASKSLAAKLNDAVTAIDGAITRISRIGGASSGSTTTNAAGDIVVTALTGMSRGAGGNEADAIAARWLSGNVDLGSNKNADGTVRVSFPPNVYSILGSVLGDSIGGKTGREIAKRLPDVLQGVGVGQMIGGVIGGQKGATIGGIIGGVGGLGKSLSDSGFLPKGVSGALGKVGAVGGILATAFSIGEAIGGLFSGRPSASAVVQSVYDKQWAYGSEGSADNVKETVDGIQSTLSKVIEALGATAGAFKVSIGQYGDWFRVSASGSPNVADKRFPQYAAYDTLYDGPSAEEAVRIAVLNAISDGAVAGIREGAKRLLTQGQDLERAVNRALSFQNVFDRLKQRTEPVAYAVDQVNKEFTKLLQVFKDAQASDQEYADLARLYDLERADAIKQATNDAVSAIDQFIKDMTGSQSSPLNRMDTYQSAAQALDAFKADINSGKVVDQNELLSAARNFQDASRALNGSGSAFFDDFYALKDLLTRARDNAGITNVSNLPGNPVGEDSVVKAAIERLSNTQTGVIQDQTIAIVTTLEQILAALGGGGGGSGSIGGLPGFQNANYL